MSILLYLAAWLLTPTAEANRWAAELVGGDGVAAYDCDAPVWRQGPTCPERLSWALQTVSDRESPGNYSDRRRWLGRHRGDASAGRRVQRRARAAGQIHDWCPWHRDAADMSTWGVHGQMYAYNVQRLRVAGNCLPPWILGFPRISAIVAARRYARVCSAEAMNPLNPRGRRGDGWCPSVVEQLATRHRRAQRGELPLHAGGALVGGTLDFHRLWHESCGDHFVAVLRLGDLLADIVHRLSAGLPKSLVSTMLDGLKPHRV